MAVRIAFGSCSRATKYPKQPVWNAIAQHAPQHLVLLGDQMYMDFGLPVFGGNLYEPRGMTFQEFVDVMHARYRAQYEVPEFSDLLRAQPAPDVHMTWDDHDFAWNNAVGGRADEDFHVPLDKRRASRLLFEQFREALRTRPAQYPPAPQWPADSSTLVELGGVHSSFTAAGVRVILLDLRTWADLPGEDGELLGPAGSGQDAWLDAELGAAGDEIILASSLTLSKGTSWDDYPRAYERLLRKLAGKKVLVLSGDIHVNHLKSHRNPFGPYPLHEATSSGLAIYGYKLSYFGDLSNSGLVEINDEVIRVRLYRDLDAPDGELAIRRQDWRADVS